MGYSLKGRELLDNETWKGVVLEGKDAKKEL